jgi:hypothetical protein
LCTGVPRRASLFMGVRVPERQGARHLLHKVNVANETSPCHTRATPRVTPRHIRASLKGRMMPHAHDFRYIMNQSKSYR